MAVVQFYTLSLNTNLGERRRKLCSCIQTFSRISSIFRNHKEWTLVSSSVKAGGNFVVLDLNPATWYNLKVTAHNNAGFSVAEYEFATLTVRGGKSDSKCLSILAWQ